MLKIIYTNQFKKRIQNNKKRGYKISKLKEVISILAEGKRLPIKYREHYLLGEYKRV